MARRRSIGLLGALALILAALATVSPQPAAAYKSWHHDAPVHESIAEYALGLYDGADGETGNTELLAYWVDPDDPTPSKPSMNSIKAGTADEDDHDHVYGYWCWDGKCTVPHFWDADKGPGQLVRSSTFGNVPNSWMKATSLWSLALGLYAAGNESDAHDRLGHVAHLLMDQSVPAHAHSDTHWPDDDTYEDWLKAPSNHRLTEAELAALALEGPVGIPAEQPEADGELCDGCSQDVGSPWELYWLMYTTNQIGDFFASDDRDGDGYRSSTTDPYNVPPRSQPDDPLGWSRSELGSIWDALPMEICVGTPWAEADKCPLKSWHLDDNDDGDNDDDGDLSTLREYSYFKAIRAVAALYRLFEETTQGDLLTVSVGHVRQKDYFDPFWGKPDFFPRVKIDGSEFRAAPKRDDKQIDPVDWAFGSTTAGITGRLPVEIEIWDDDSWTTGDDDQADISPRVGRTLKLDVDLGACSSNAPLAVMYAGTDDPVGAGTCGAPITVTGNASNDVAELTFTIGFRLENLSQHGPTTPIDIDPAAGTVAEDAATGATVGVTAYSSDPGEDDEITYSLTGEGDPPFTIDPSSGVITVDRESQLDGPEEHTITVLASNGKAVSAADFTISVTNVDPHVSVSASSVSAQYSDPVPEVAIEAADVKLDPARDEIQLLQLTGGAEGDTFALTYNAHECPTRVTIPSRGFAGVEAEDVEACLESIYDWTGNADDIQVEKDGPDFGISFSGDLGSADIGPITVTPKSGEAAGSVIEVVKGNVGDTLSASATLPDAGTISGGLTLTGAGGAGTGSWTLGGIADLAPGTHPVTVTVTDDDGGSADMTIQVVVTPEDATVTFDPGNPVAVQVASEGGNSGPFTLEVGLTDADDGYPGNIGQATLGMTLVPIGPGSPVPGSCTSAAAGLWSCDFAGVPVNTYSAMATVGGYYTGGSEDVLVVFDPSLGLTSGGGWYLDPASGDRVNFGYTMKYNKKATSIQGNLLVIRHTGDDEIYRLKSNALFGLAIGSDTSFAWASFAGKATYQEPGWADAVGNYQFTVYVEDHDASGLDGDRIWLTAQGNGYGPTGFEIGGVPIDDAVTIGGGNIVVPH